MAQDRRSRRAFDPMARRQWLPRLRNRRNPTPRGRHQRPRRRQGRGPSTARSSSPPHAGTASRTPRSWYNCPRKLGTDLIYLKSEDHYVEVHTSVGSTLIKMRFADAVAELGEYGIQVHRSYWVATRHVRRLVKSGKRRMVRLNGGHELPVSASYLSVVRAAVPH